LIDAFLTASLWGARFHAPPVSPAFMPKGYREFRSVCVTHSTSAVAVLITLTTTASLDWQAAADHAANTTQGSIYQRDPLIQWQSVVTSLTAIN